MMLTGLLHSYLTAAKEPSSGAGAGKGQSIFKKANTMSSGLFAAAMAETDAEGEYLSHSSMLWGWCCVCNVAGVRIG
jgi:hypothetical protein